MNFLRHRSLRRLSIYALLLMLILFVAQYLAIRHHIESLEEAERKIDFARNIQIGNHRIAFQTQLFIHGNKQLASEIASKIDEQDHQLKILAEGGRVDGSMSFIKPLSRLPKITFDNLRERWDNYKATVTEVITEDGEPLNKEVPVDSLSSSNNPAFSSNNSKIIEGARWISLSNWFDKLIIDLEEVVEEKQKALNIWFIFFLIFDSVLMALLVLGFYKQVILPLKRLETNIINRTHTLKSDKNEVGNVTNQVNEVIENLKDATDFVTAIRDGKLDIDYKETLDPEYIPGKNNLADSLIQMQAKLKVLTEDERKRQWANEGITKFVEIMRSSNDNLSTLGDAVISGLVEYTRSNQGALYILNDEDPNAKHLELISLFAFNAKKYQQQKIKLGEGILGQTFLEKETTHLTNVPDEYARITSGLGDASPKSVLLFPLKIDREAYGIVELASLHEYQDYEIDFVEKLGESIASTLSSVKAAQKNRQLIEQFQQQTEEMRAQEEEMRQNMEELQATQEEVTRKEQAYLERISELENVKKRVDVVNEIESLTQAAENPEHVARN